MSWDNILGQDRVKKIISNAILNNRVSSSYLFTGMEGVGKEYTAIEFAKTFNCQNKKFLSNQNSNENENQLVYACNQCKSCNDINNLSSENLMLIFALPTTKTTAQNDDPIKNLDDEQYKELKSHLQLKVEDKYHKIQMTNATQIKINAIRELKKQLSFNSTVGGRKFAIIIDSETMTTEAANAFLKTLEEPNDNITLILVSSTPEKILQTILSRCQEIKFEPIERSILINYLIEKFDKNIEEAELISNFSQGSLSKAMEFIDDDIQQIRTEIVELLRTAVKKKYRIDLLNQIEDFVKAKDKNTIELALKLLIIWLRDVVIYKRILLDNNNSTNLVHQTNIQRLIVNKDQIDIVSKFAEHFGKSDFNNIIQKIEDSNKRIFQNVNLYLMLIDLFLDIRDNLLINR